MYWNYFYHVWKTVSSNPFANAVVFVETVEGADPEFNGFSAIIDSIIETDNGTRLITRSCDTCLPNYIQTEDATEDGVAVQRYGAYILPEGVDLLDNRMNATVNGVLCQNADTESAITIEVGAEIPFEVVTE